MVKSISYKEAKKSLNQICKKCNHLKGFHIFWNQEDGHLELLNCNECSCKKFI